MGKHKIKKPTTTSKIKFTFFIPAFACYTGEPLAGPDENPRI